MILKLYNNTRFSPQIAYAEFPTAAVYVGELNLGAQRDYHTIIYITDIDHDMVVVDTDYWYYISSRAAAGNGRFEYTIALHPFNLIKDEQIISVQRSIKEIDIVVDPLMFKAQPEAAVYFNNNYPLYEDVETWAFVWLTQIPSGTSYVVNDDINNVDWSFSPVLDGIEIGYLYCFAFPLVPKSINVDAWVEGSLNVTGNVADFLQQYSGDGAVANNIVSVNIAQIPKSLINIWLSSNNIPSGGDSNNTRGQFMSLVATIGSGPDNVLAAYMLEKFDVYKSTRRLLSGPNTVREVIEKYSCTQVELKAPNGTITYIPAYEVIDTAIDLYLSITPHTVTVKIVTPFNTLGTAYLVNSSISLFYTADFLTELARQRDQSRQLANNMTGANILTSALGLSPNLYGDTAQMRESLYDSKGSSRTLSNTLYGKVSMNVNPVKFISGTIQKFINNGIQAKNEYEMQKGMGKTMQVEDNYADIALYSTPFAQANFIVKVAPAAYIDTLYLRHLYQGVAYSSVYEYERIHENFEYLQGFVLYLKGEYKLPNSIMIPLINELLSNGIYILPSDKYLDLSSNEVINNE